MGAGADIVSVVGFLLKGAGSESAEGGGGVERLESVDMSWGARLGSEGQG